MSGAESIPLPLGIIGRDALEATSIYLSFASGVAAYGMLLRDPKCKGTATFYSGVLISYRNSGAKSDPFSHWTVLNGIDNLLKSSASCNSN